MANHNKFSMNRELPTPGKTQEVIDVSPEASQEQGPQTQHPAEQNVENAKSRIEALEGRGAEIRSKVTEKVKNIGKWSVSKIDRGIGRVASGAEKAKGKLADAREYAGDLKDAATERMSQRQARKERKRTTKERAISDQFNTAKADEEMVLSGVRAGDAEAFNYMESGTDAEQAGRAQAKQEAIDTAHAEALEENSRYDRAYNAQKQRHELGDTAAWGSLEGMSDIQRKAYEAANREQMDSAKAEALEENERHDEEERERLEQESQEAEDTYNRVEDFLKKEFKGRKDVGLTEVRQALRAQFGEEFNSGKDHVVSAIEDAHDVFSGKKMKQAARAARIAKGKAKVAEVRHKSYEAVRNRSSEVYQKALKSGKKLGKAIGKFTKRTATAAKRAGTAGAAGFNAARDTWKAAKESATTEAEPVTNE